VDVAGGDAGVTASGGGAKVFFGGVRRGAVDLAVAGFLTRFPRFAAERFFPDLALASRFANDFFARRASLRAFFAARSTDFHAFFAVLYVALAARASCFAAVAAASARSASVRAAFTVRGVSFDFCGFRFMSGFSP
jgi:hypothetical protein